MSGDSDLAPRWLNQAEARAAAAGAPEDWLFVDRGSLTERLQALSDDRFAVELLAEGWQRLRADECQALTVSPTSIGWVREVWLCGQGEPWVFARSVAGRAALEAADFDLASLGRRPLGHWLFQAPAFARGPLQACRYPPQWLPPASRVTDCWARRSVFRRDDLGILVAEAFLPAFWQRLASADREGRTATPGPL